MKTPRDILLGRHQSAMPKLDVMRYGVVRKLNMPPEAARQRGPTIANLNWFVSWLNNVWRELVWPSRRIWAGLAAVWVLIIAVNYSMRDRSQPQMAVATPSPQMILAFRQQEQLLTELIGPNDPPVAEPAKPSLPSPTSQRREEILTT